MHASAIPPDEERFVSFHCSFHEVHCCHSDFHVYRLHAFLGQWTRVFDPAIGIAVNDTAWPKLFPKLRILRVVGKLWFFLCIQVVEIAKKFIEPMICWQHGVPVTKVIFTKLSGHVSEWFEQTSDSRVFHEECYAKSQLLRSAVDRVVLPRSL